jgi:hypothetical protein
MSSPLAMVLAEANRQAPQPSQPTVAPTNVAGIYANNDAQNMAAYQAHWRSRTRSSAASRRSAVR